MSLDEIELATCSQCEKRKARWECSSCAQPFCGYCVRRCRYLCPVCDAEEIAEMAP